MSVGAEAQLPSAWIVALTAIASNGNTGYFAGVSVKDKDILFITSRMAQGADLLAYQKPKSEG